MKMGKTFLLAGTALCASALFAGPVAAAGNGDWYNNTSISGRMYYDFSNISHKNDGVKQADTGTNFDIKRFYVSIDHQFSDVFSGDITTDFNYVGNDGQTQLYIKKAYLRAHFSDAFDLRLGSTDMPWIPFIEGLYGYRYVENTLIDRTKFGTSADWGIHVNGKLAGGVLNYAFSVVNGSGYKKPVRSKGVDFEGRVNANFNHFTVGVGGYVGKLGKDVQGGAPTYHTANRFDAVAAYKSKQFRLGVEYFLASNWNNVTNPVSDKSEGVGAFASYQFNPEWGVFGRYDFVKPNKTTNPSLKDHYFNVGVSYSPTKIVDFSLVYKRDKADNGFIKTSNGTIGGINSGTYNEIGIFSRFRW